MKILFGGYLELTTDEKIVDYTDAMDIHMAINMIEGAIEFGVRNGLYNTAEAYSLYKCILKLKPLTEEVKTVPSEGAH